MTQKQPLKVGPVDRSERRSFYRPELDVLRFFAFFCVFLTHGVSVNLSHGILEHHPSVGQAITFLDAAGSYGLPLFFFLSAFLITTLLLLEKQKTGEVQLRRFYLRRILRLWPLYFMFLLVCFALGLVWAPVHFNARALLAFLTLSGNWYVIVAGATPDTINLLWSISVEEQFYLLWPNVMRRLSEHSVRKACIALSVFSLGNIAVLSATHSTLINIWYDSGSQLLFLSGGGLLGTYLGLRRQQKSGWKAAAAFVVGGACWLGADLFRGTRLNTELFPALPAVASYLCICLGCGVFVWSFLHMPQQWLRPKLIYLGRISYGLYVFQGIALIIGKRFVEPHLRGGMWLIVSLALVVLMAVPSYEFYEKPFLKLKHRFELVHSRPV